MKKLGIIMDPIAGINIAKDSSFAMLLEAQRRNYQLNYLAPEGLYLRNGVSRGASLQLGVTDNQESWFEYLAPTLDVALSSMDVILMRKDPPFNMDYVYLTYLLDLAEQAGALIVNKPQALRDANEKMFTAHFPQCCVETLVSRDIQALREFVQSVDSAIVKPLDGMGGTSIFKTFAGDPNLNVILETITDNGMELTMCQRFVPDIAEGDKRILLIDGKPVAYALARIPSAEDFRGNLAKGGTGHGQPLSEHDYWIAAQVGPELKRRGVLFAGLDVIGDYLTEVNVTSPTCIRELDKQFDLNISADLFDAIEQKLTAAVPRA